MNILKWRGLDIDPMKISESITTKAEISQIDTSFNESTNESGITVLYPKIEAIHEGRTRNFNRYLAEKLKGDPDLRSGVYSWTAPYPKPVIHNHDTNTEATGRVYSASYSEYTSAGRPGIIVTPKITQEKAIKDILEGRLLTVSIGASTNAAVCTICGTDIINEGFCGHMRGEEYDGKMAEWVAGDLFFDELSWVNVPADSDAMITSSGLTNNMMSTGESKTPIDAGRIVTGTFSAADIKSNVLTTETAENTDTSTSVLTEEPVVVKKVSESTEKEESIVTIEDKIDPATTEAEEVKQPVVEEKDEAITKEATEEEVVKETATKEDAVEVVEEEAAIDTKTALTEQEVDANEFKKVQEDLVEANQTIAELTTANEQLAKDLQESTVSFLIDLRMATGKETSREEAVAKYTARSLESLRDSISDILAEKPSIQTTTRKVEQVEKPTGASITESKTLATKEVKVISNEQALLSLLSGRAN